jgi:hypothetical protein
MIQSGSNQKLSVNVIEVQLELGLRSHGLVKIIPILVPSINGSGPSFNNVTPLLNQNQNNIFAR